MAEQRIVFIYRSALVPPVILDEARKRLPPGFTLTLCDETVAPDERRDQVRTADFVMLYGAPFDDLDAAAGHVGLLQLLSAGYDRLDLEGLAAAGVRVANNGGANAQTVAEHAVLLMLAVLKRLPQHHAELSAGNWLGLSQGLELRELCGKRVGVIGMGRIGGRVARMVSAFDAEPVFTDVAGVEPPPGVAARRVDLESLLESADIITLHTPLTAETRGMIGAAEIARMRPGTVLVNTSRGEIVDEAALSAALLDGRLGGAGLDVFEREPAGPQNPLVALAAQMSNVIITPHVAGTTLDTWWRRLAFAYANMQRVAAGGPAESLIGA